jgi:3',5'-cyclic AMP phosphodiesterase CpdA
LAKNSPYSQKVLKSTIEDINTLDDVSFVVFTGDNVNYATEDDLKIFASIAKKLKVPYYVVIGNHDVYKTNGMPKSHYLAILRKSNIKIRQRKPNYKWRKKGFEFLIVDGAKEVIPGPAGYFRKDTLNWLDKTLTQNRKRTVVIFQHFPVEYPDGAKGRLKTHKTYKVEDYKAILDSHDNVLAVISGHLHTNGENMKNGVYHISTPSLLGMPHSYKIIDIVTMKDFSPIIYTQLREVEVKDTEQEVKPVTKIKVKNKNKTESKPEEEETETRPETDLETEN